MKKGKPIRRKSRMCRPLHVKKTQSSIRVDRWRRQESKEQLGNFYW